MYGQHIGKWPRKGWRGGWKGVLNKSSMRCAHFNLARAHEAGLHMKFRHTHEWIIRQAKAKASAEAEADWICYSTPACLCVYGYCMGIYVLYVYECVYLEKVGSVPPSHVSRSSWRSNRFKSSLLACPAVTVAYCCCCCCGWCWCRLHQSSKKAQANRRRPTIIALILAIIPSRFQTGACSDDTQIASRIVLDFNFNSVFLFA